MNVREVSPADRRGVKALTRLEREFMASHPLFWSAPDVDVRTQLSGRSAFFQDVEHALFVAERQGEVVARCAALINGAWQRSHAGEEKTGFIGYFAARPGASEATAALLARAEGWLAERGIRRVIAPFNGSALIGMGLLTDAFDESPMFPLVVPAHAAHGFLNAGESSLQLVAIHPCDHVRTGAPGTTIATPRAG